MQIDAERNPNGNRYEVRKTPITTSTGLDIYGLSGDSPKSNTSFVTKQSLNYTLLCNPSFSLIGAIGLQQGSAHKTQRGVFAVDKSGKVLLLEPGSPEGTMKAVQKLVDGGSVGSGATAGEAKKQEKIEGAEAANGEAKETEEEAEKPVAV